MQSTGCKENSDTGQTINREQQMIQQCQHNIIQLKNLMLNSENKPKDESRPSRKTLELTCLAHVNCQPLKSNFYKIGKFKNFQLRHFL